MNSIAPQAIYNISSELYEAAVENDPAGWQHAYARLSRLVGSGPGSIHFRHRSDNDFEPVADTNMPGFIANFNSLYFHMLPYREEILRLKAGEEFTRTRDFPDEVYLRSEIYNDHFGKIGLYEILHYCLFEDELVTGGVTFTRPTGVGPFDRNERAALNAILPHLQRAARLHLKIVRVNQRDRMVREAWNAVPQPMALISSRRRIVYMNKAAERLSGQRDGFWFGERGELRCSVPAECQIIRQLIDGIFVSSNGAPAFGGQTVVSREMRRPLRVSIAPFREADRIGAGAERFALVLVTDPEFANGPSEQDLRGTYGLTKAESRIAGLLAEGRTISEICNMMEITHNTVKTHLKRIFSKTSTTRQTELIKLLLSFPTAFQKKS